MLKSFPQGIRAPLGGLKPVQYCVGVVVVTMLLSACEPSPERQQAADWRYANVLKTEEAFRKFLEDWPNSDKVPTAERSLEALSWRSAAWTNTEESYSIFLANWSDGIFAPLADEMLAWFNERGRLAVRDTQILIDLSFLISMRTVDKQENARNRLADTTAGFLVCAGYSVVEAGKSPSSRAKLDVIISGSGIDRRYQFPNRDDITVISGTEMRGSLSWHPSTGASIRREFAHYDAPPETAVLFRNEVDDLKDGMQTQSIHRALAAEGSFWDQLVPLVLERAGPRAFLCPTGVSMDASLWYRAREKVSMPTTGAAVAALFSDQFGRVEGAARMIAYSGAPFSDKYIERYLEGFANYSDQRELAQHLLDQIRQP